MVLKEKEIYYTTRNGIPVVVEVIRSGSTHGVHALLQIIQADEETLVGQHFCIEDTNFEKLQPFVCNIFKIGQTVMSNQGNRFIVTGYEASNNRVIVRSLKNTSDRVRYSYAYNEMTVIDDYAVCIGKTYKINELHYAICATHPNFSDQVIFVITKNGSLGKTCMCPCTDTDIKIIKYINRDKALSCAGIMQIEEVIE